LSARSASLIFRHETPTGGIVPNRHPLTVKPDARAANARRRPARVSLGCVLTNWGALVALWALPYLSLLDHLRPGAAHSETLQWSLLGIGVLGIASLLATAWRDTRDPAWRAKHGLLNRARPDRPHTENIA
jgi:hypothetical protein